MISHHIFGSITFYVNTTEPYPGTRNTNTSDSWPASDRQISLKTSRWTKSKKNSRNLTWINSAVWLDFHACKSLIVNNIFVHEWLSQYVPELTWFDKFFLMD